MSEDPQLDPLSGDFPAPRPAVSYLLCSTPRTGSSLLCDALRATGVAGRPEEYFQFRARTGQPRRPLEYFEGVDDPEVLGILGPRSQNVEDEERYDPSRFRRYEDYLAWAIVEATTPNGVLGAKVMWGYFNGFVTGLRWAVPGRQKLPVCELAPSVFPNLHSVFVTRRDKVRQAVSLWKAIQTWSWSTEQRGPESHPLVYSEAAIDHLIRDIHEHESGWRAYFRSCGVRPLTVIYEDFVERYGETIREILRYVGVGAATELEIAPPRRRQQADELSEEWIDRYRGVALRA
jgi:LPS sulfotransferase NodH